MAMSTTALSENFYNEFQTRFQIIRDAIDADTEAYIKRKSNIDVEKHQATTAELQRKVQDANIFTNSHDQRVYARDIKALQDKVQALRSLVKPKTKFSFKSARKTTDVRPEAPSHVETGLASSASKDKAASIKTNLENLLGNDDQAIEYKNISLIGERSLLSATTSIQNVSASIVDLSRHQPGQLAGLHIINATTSIILTGPVSGGLHITNMHDSVLIAQTHQLRMHQCSNVVIYLAAGSSPIIENCSQVTFAPLEPHPSKSSLKVLNAWDQVSDFQYPGLVGQSPNWSIVPEVNRVIVEETSAGGVTLQGTPVDDITRFSELKEMLMKFAVSILGTKNAAGEDHALESVLK